MYSQRHPSTFSTVIGLNVSRGNEYLLKGDFNGDGVTDIASYGSKFISISFAINDSTEWDTKSFLTDFKIMSAVTADFNKDGHDDIAALSADKRLLKIYLSRKPDSLVYKWKTEFAQSYDFIKTADINYDGKADILLYGKNVLGLTVLLGRGDGTFRPPQVILSDYSFSSVGVHDFNGDDLPDLFCVNWVSNEVQLFSSYAQLRYLLPSTITFSDEPHEVTPAFINPDDLIDLIVTFKDKPILKTYLGNGFGNFELYQNLELLYPVDKILGDDINNTGSIDLLLFNKTFKYLSLWQKDTTGLFAVRTIYSAGKNPNDVFLFTNRTSDYLSLAIASPLEKKIFLVDNSNSNSQLNSEANYITGLLPTGLRAYDVTKNGNIDIILANQGSKSVSYFENKGGGVFTGQVSFPIASEKPNSLTVLHKNSDRMYAITSHSSTSQIAVTEIDFTDYTSSTYAISTSPFPTVMDVTVSKSTGFLNIFVNTTEPEQKYFQFFNFEQIGKTKYLEKELLNLETPKIRGGFILNAAQSVGNNFIYIKEISNNNLNLCSKNTNGTQKPTKGKCYYSIKDTTIQKVLFSKGDLNNDKYQDLIIYSPSSKELLLSLNNNDTSFYQPHQRLKNIKLNSVSDVQVCDFDGDNKNDLIVANYHTRTLQLYSGKGDGSFSPPKRLLGIEAVSSFVVSDFNNDMIPDLALSYSEDGFIKIIYGQK
ncbi:MAG: VCBS repeat-containing protein [Bacteroidota bacterium]|nr:VCBS repeat-containing protein [Bacteroidota bacterium]